MKLPKGIFGVCVLLLIAQSQAAKNTRSNFWKVPWGSYENDLTFDTEGSGFDENDKESTGIHEDDEDYDYSSGDNMIDLTPTDDDDNNDDDYYSVVDEDKDTTDDEDDLVDGSGSGDGIEEPIVPEGVKPVENVKVTTPSSGKQLTPCENLQRSAKLAQTSYVPDCDNEGKFEKVQCVKDDRAGKHECWCVDYDGIKIDGTIMAHPKKPDCVYGANLKTCVFQMVQSRQDLLGAYRPRCDEMGEYEPMQCQGSLCWCVDSIGNEIVGTEATRGVVLNCSQNTGSKVIGKPVKPEESDIDIQPDDGYTVSGNTKEDIDNVVVNIGPEVVDEENSDEFEIENNRGPYATIKREEPILAQPGLLAAIIGGAVVGLLCMVLLVMFIVYRMRKKDEGSYPLDEQKYQNYSYTKAPDKEFYA
ncbi:Cell surface proteoglycan [Mactra antiquata]